MTLAPEASRFYDTTGLWWGDPGIRDSGREVAARLAPAAGRSPLCVLELGAGRGGAAAAAADLGHRVVAIEASPVRAAMARSHTRVPRQGRLTVVEADFYEVEVAGPFDVVAYWNGFGIGSDRDQRRLLERIRGWLRPDGLVLMHVYDPEWWRAHDGRRRREGELIQEIGFLRDERSLVDRWWPEDRPADAVSERIRCYSEDHLRALLTGTGLALRASTRDEGSPWKYLVELRPA